MKTNRMILLSGAVLGVTVLAGCHDNNNPNSVSSNNTDQPYQNPAYQGRMANSSTQTPSPASPYSAVPATMPANGEGNVQATGYTPADQNPSNNSSGNSYTNTTAGGANSTVSSQSYSSTPATQPDNTAVNARDRDTNAQTPTAQGENRTDIQTTAAIRRNILHEDLSVDARNVKIITQNGHVVLRGPVKSVEEKQTIGRCAGQVAGPDNVDNQLEVASSD